MATEARQTHLFTLRVWQEARGDGDREIRLKIQHVLSGEVRYFGSWLLLKEFVMDTVRLDVEDT